MIHLMSHAQYTWSSFYLSLPFSSDNCLLHAINEAVSNCTLNMVDCTETEPSSYKRPWRIVVVFSQYSVNKLQVEWYRLIGKF